jgi:hypothetical protein
LAGPDVEIFVTPQIAQRIVDIGNTPYAKPQLV